MTDNVTGFPDTPAIRNRRVMAEQKKWEEERDRFLEFIEPIVISDEVISGCVKVERLGHGMVRLWLYGTEDLAEKMKIIRAKLVMPEELAREMAAKIAAELTDAPVGTR